VYTCGDPSVDHAVEGGHGKRGGVSWWPQVVSRERLTLTVISPIQLQTTGSNMTIIHFRAHARRRSWCHRADLCHRRHDVPDRQRGASTSCHGDTHGEDDALVWLDQYDYELETDYAQSDPVKAGPDGQGDYRPHG
jgi:hypothetical protein